MVAAFAAESGMNLRYSEQCLAENGWDYNKAGQVFLELKVITLKPLICKLKLCFDHSVYTNVGRFCNQKGRQTQFTSSRMKICSEL